MSKKGFTLIELLVVIFIIGLLASIVIVGTGEARKKARDTKRMADLNSVQTALELYKDKNGRYPCQGINYEDSNGDGSKELAMKWNDSSKKPNTWVGDGEPGENLDKFLPTLPDDPTNRYTSPRLTYAYASINGKEYKIIAYNMESGTGKTQALNDGGVSGWGDNKYELFSSGGQWYWGPTVDPNGVVVDKGDCPCKVPVPPPTSCP